MTSPVGSALRSSTGYGLPEVPCVHEPAPVALHQIEHYWEAVHEHVFGEASMDLVRRDMALILGRFHYRSVSLLRLGGRRPTLGKRVEHVLQRRRAISRNS